MLSRVADSLYWLGRYLERAEHLTRLLMVTEDLSTEVQGLDEALARSEWADLVAVFPGAWLTDRPLARGAHFALPYLTSFLLEDANQYSALYSLRRARDNARSVREALTLEVFLSLNETYHHLEEHARKGIDDVPAFRDALGATQQGLLATIGAVEHTLTRDTGWSFLRLGGALERIWRTARILTVKLPGLRQSPPQTDLPLYYTRWRSLLRSLASLENYRTARGAEMDPTAIVEFVLLDPAAPRALNYGCHAVKVALDRLALSSEATPAQRIAGKLCARLDYEGRDLMHRDYYLVFLQEILAEVERLHEAIGAQYFVV